MNFKLKPNLILKAEIIRQGYNLKTFCAEMAMDESGFNRRINGKVPFKEDEIYLIANKLNKSVNELFFAERVAVLATKQKEVKRVGAINKANISQ